MMCGCSNVATDKYFCEQVEQFCSSKTSRTWKACRGECVLLSGYGSVCTEFITLLHVIFCAWSSSVFRPHHSTMFVDAAHCYWQSSVVCRSVCLSVTLVSPAKTAVPIEMPFGLRTWVGPRNHVLDGVQIPPWEGAILRGERGLPLWSIGTLCSHLCINGWTDWDAIWVVGYVGS